ncbi:MAG: isocitrate/isopropylmalate dehydrogenase family protein [Planctomycetes bacterium]|nr:isocitrate/isopropylmalate dehydrogenase family protein [Planctomycetota bacterium]MCB9889050.1 isocitrate/isopropylmalate dehydrogenase family protein [Planctomycetota bacterium]
MSTSIALIPGDGIGPEVSEAARRVIDATGLSVDWHMADAGGDVIHRYGTPLPEETLETIVRCGVALKGPITTPIGSGFRSVNVNFRKRLDLYANFRPARSYPGVPSRYADVDLIVVRENTEGLYSGLEHVVVPGVVESLRVITERSSERIVRYAFEIARQHGRKKVTSVHKANILKLSDGLFLEVARRVARGYDDIVYEEAIVDATAMRLVLDPSQFDVLVMENLFGDIVSDLTSGLVGGLGMAPSGNIGEKFAVFEAVHGSAPDIAGKGVANPTALILSGALMLRHLDEGARADRVEAAVREVLGKGACVTRDLGGTASTKEYTDAVIEALGRS